MISNLIYLHEPNRLQAPVRVIDVIRDADNGCEVATDVTPFYPQGGGQPSDTGFLERDGVRVRVTKVRKLGDRIFHRIEETIPAIGHGDEFMATVDGDLRTLHSRLHTAGELVCAAVHNIVPSWRVKSAMHYPAACSVTFLPGETSVRLDDLPRLLTEEINGMIARDHVVEVLGYVDRSEAERMVGYSLGAIPADEPIRLVRPAPGYYRACIGTHAGRTGDLGTVRIRKVKQRKGEVVVSYEVEGNDDSS